jgi:hypothetical protein
MSKLIERFIASSDGRRMAREQELEDQAARERLQAEAAELRPEAARVDAEWAEKERAAQMQIAIDQASLASSQGALAEIQRGRWAAVWPLEQRIAKIEARLRATADPKIVDGFARLDLASEKLRASVRTREHPAERAATRPSRRTRMRSRRTLRR